VLIHIFKVVSFLAFILLLVISLYIWGMGKFLKDLAQGLLKITVFFFIIFCVYKYRTRDDRKMPLEVDYSNQLPNHSFKGYQPSIDSAKWISPSIDSAVSKSFPKGVTPVEIIPTITPVEIIPTITKEEVIKIIRALSEEDDSLARERLKKVLELEPPQLPTLKKIKDSKL